jgi:hypothetical protein
MVPLRVLAAFAVAALAVACTVQFETEGYYDESFDLGENGELTVTGLSGDAAISGWDAHRAVMRGTKSAVGASPARARDNLDYAVFTAARGPVELTLSFDPPASRVGLVDLVLDRGSRVPRGAHLKADTRHGDLTISGVEGDLDLETGSGDISVSGAAGDVVAVSDTGDVSVESYGGMEIDAGGAADVVSLGGGDGAIRVTTSGGELSFAVSAAQSFEITCDAEGGDVIVDPDLSAVVEKRAGGGVTVRRGQGGRSVVLGSGGGDILIDAAPRIAADR